MSVSDVMVDSLNSCWWIFYKLGSATMARQKRIEEEMAALAVTCSFNQNFTVENGERLKICHFDEPDIFWGGVELKRRGCRPPPPTHSATAALVELSISK